MKHGDHGLAPLTQEREFVDIRDRGQSLAAHRIANLEARRLSLRQPIHSHDQKPKAPFGRSGFRHTNLELPRCVRPKHLTRVIKQGATGESDDDGERIEIAWVANPERLIPSDGLEEHRVVDIRRRRERIDAHGVGRGQLAGDCIPNRDVLGTAA